MMFSPTAKGGISRYNEAQHLDGIIALHEREPVRFARSLDDAAALLALPKMNVWVTTHDAEVVAYLVEGDAVNKRGIIEMIYVVNPLRVTRRVREQLFVWGLDYA